MIHWRLNSAEFSDLKIWTTSETRLAVPLPWGENVFGLFTIYKQTKIHSVCIWYSWNACVESAQWQRTSICLGRRVSMWEHVHKNPAKAAGSRRLRFKSQHSYYGFHEACKVLCICFDQPLFGLTSHIKILGLHLVMSSPCKACFLKRDVAFRDSWPGRWRFSSRQLFFDKRFIVASGFFGFFLLV